MPSLYSPSTLLWTQLLQGARNCLAMITQIFSVPVIPHMVFGKDPSHGVMLQTKMLTNYYVLLLNILRKELLLILDLPAPH